METARLSTKGRIVLPKSIRTSRGWGPGTNFVVEETGDGILLRPAGRFPKADLEDVAGCLRSKRKAKTPTQMRNAIASRSFGVMTAVDTAEVPTSCLPTTCPEISKHLGPAR